jgi:hypothetical protein
MIDALGIVPFIPSGADFHRSRDPFRALGFEETWSADEFASNLMIRIDVPDLDAWWAETSAKQLESRFPGFRIKPPTAFPWGRESHFIDLAGVCWHVGQP